MATSDEAGPVAEEKSYHSGPRAGRVRDSTLLLVLTGSYVATLVVANTTAGKLFNFYGTAISAGAFAYMLCLTLSDIAVDLYGKRIGFLLVGMGTLANVLTLAFSQLALRLPPAEGQEWLQPHFVAVFSSSASVIVASLIGYPITDSVETVLWKWLKDRIGRHRLWARNAIVKAVGQLLDATVFFTLAFFVLPLAFYGEPMMPGSSFMTVMRGAWIYGLWKGLLLGNLLYPVLRVALSAIRTRRIADVPYLAQAAQDESW